MRTVLLMSLQTEILTTVFWDWHGLPPLQVRWTKLVGPKTYGEQRVYPFEKILLSKIFVIVKYFMYIYFLLY